MGKKLSLLANSVTCDRALEDLRTLQQQKRETTIMNIEKAQLHQLKGQNERQRITTNRLTIGTKVYLEIKGLHDKLHQKYKGPFTVVEVDELRGTYRLADRRGKTLKDKFQLSRLKLDLEPDAQVKKVFVQKRVEPVAELTNVRTKEITKAPGRRSSRIAAKAASNFVSIVLFLGLFCGVIAKNNSSIHGAKELGLDSKTVKDFILKKSDSLWNLEELFMTKPKDGKKSIKEKFLSRANNFVDDTTMSSNDTYYNLSNNYSVCELNKDLWSRPIVFNNDCRRERLKKSSNLLIVGSTFSKLNVLVKVTNEVQGNIFICEIEQVEVKTYKNFFGAGSHELKTNSISISGLECRAMIQTKECRGNVMICNNNLCKYNGTPKLEYRYLSESVKLGYSCKLKTKFISLKNSESELFHKCKVKNLTCRLGKSIAVWKRDIIMKCPYKFITKIEELRSKPNDILTNEENALFQVNKLDLICGSIKSFVTTEGLVLAENSEIINDLPKSELEFSALHELIMSEADFNMAKSIDSLNELRLQSCLEQTEILNVMQLEEDKYFRIYSQNNKNIILYVKNKLLHVPRCFDVRNISIAKKQHSDCSSDIEVSFHLEDKLVNGFLNDNRIVRMDARSEQCKGAFVQKESDKLIVKKNGFVYMKTPPNKISAARLLEMRESELNFIHFDKLLKGINIFDGIVEQEGDLLEDELDIHYNKLDAVGNTKIGTDVIEFQSGLLTGEMSKWFKNIKLLALSLSLLLLITVMIGVAIVVVKNCMKKRRKRRDRTTMLEMHDIHELLKTVRS